MSLNKQAHIRYMVIDQLLRKEDGVFMEEIIRECKRAIALETADILENIELSKRTIQEDLKFFRETYGADIIQERRDVPDSKQRFIKSKSKLNTYRFRDSAFSISNLPINKKERESMLEALGVLYRLSFMKSLSWLKETISELQLIRSEGIPNEEIISFEESPQLKGIEFLKPAYDSILRKQALEIKYFSYNKNMEFNFTVSPYFLKQYNKRWFLFGRSHEFILENPDRLLNLPLDRIISLNAYDGAFIPNQGLSPSEYFKDIIGVTFDEKAYKEDILIKVKSEHFHYIESKPFHSSQIVIEKEKDWVLIQISVVPNVELESQILARGEFLEVISPVAFRNKIMYRVKKISENY
jgi:predicted DNA-binding transcriptional regulator YafY